MGLQEMLQWWNLIYILPLFISVIWLAASVAMGMHDADGDLSHDADLAHDLHIDHDVDADADHDAEGHHSPHMHGDLEYQESPLYKILALMGVGKVPVTALFGIFFLAWGAFGMLSNRVFAGILHYPAVYIWPSMAATFVVSAVFARSIAGVVGRYMPTTETYAVSQRALTDRLATAVFPITETTGTVHIRDEYGTVHRMQAKTQQNAPEIPSGSEVIVIDFDEADKRYVVERSSI